MQGRRKMAIIRKKELKQMNEAMANEKLLELKREMIRYNAQLSTGTPPENPGKLRAIKRTIARLNTTLKLLQASKPELVKEVKEKA